jgi:hypothetical protein
MPSHKKTKQQKRRLQRSRSRSKTRDNVRYYIAPKNMLKTEYNNDGSFSIKPVSCGECGGRYGSYFDEEADEMIDCDKECLTKEQIKNRRERAAEHEKRTNISPCSIQ